MPADNAGMEDAMVGALNRQPKYVSYKEYQTDKDFSLWLSGFLAKIRDVHGFKLADDGKVRAEVVRSISGKLAVGSALDAYNRLSAEDRGAYDKLIPKLSEEFVDPAEKRKFAGNFDFNKRKKKQTLKEFMQEIKKDQNRYSSIADKITVQTPAAAAGAAATVALVPNPEKERQGLRRFIAGMRDKKGKKNKALSKHLRYHVVNDKELMWENAVEVVVRWEMAQDEESESSEETSADSDDESDDEVKAVETKSRTGVKAKTMKKGKKAEEEDSCVLSAIADQVHENQMKIRGIETAQERMATAFYNLQVSNESMLQDISTKLDMCLHQNPPRGLQQQQQHQQQQQQVRFNPNSLGIPAYVTQTYTDGRLNDELPSL